MINIPSLLIALIKHFAGLSLKPYRCPAGVRSISYLWKHTGKEIIWACGLPKAKSMEEVFLTKIFRIV